MVLGGEKCRRKTDDHDGEYGFGLQSRLDWPASMVVKFLCIHTGNAPDDARDSDRERRNYWFAKLLRPKLMDTSLRMAYEPSQKTAHVLYILHSWYLVTGILESERSNSPSRLQHRSTRLPSSLDTICTGVFVDLVDFSRTLCL